MNLKIIIITRNKDRSKKEICLKNKIIPKMTTTQIKHMKQTN